MTDYLQYLPWVFMVAGLVLLIVRRLAAGGEQYEVERDRTDEILRELRNHKSSATHDMIPEKPTKRRSRSSARRETTLNYQIEAAPTPPPAPPTRKSSPAWYLHMGGVVTLLVLLSALVVILMPGTYPDAHQKWAFGAIGTIVGFWLKH